MVLFVPPATAVPPSLRSEADIRELVTAAMDDFVARDIKGAFEHLGRFWSLPAAKLSDRRAAVEHERNEARGRRGISIGWETLDVETVGKHLVRVRCLERFERSGLLWRFVFYRSDQVWTLSAVHTTEDLESAF